MQMYLPVQMIARLKALSEKTGAPVAEIIRRATETHLKKREAEEFKRPR